MTELTDYEQTWEDFWKDIIVEPDGAINLDQIKRELHDYRVLLHNIPLVYDEVTNGKISKPNTDPVHVIQAVWDRVQTSYDEGYADGLEDHKVVECHE
jgi:hypothetical protein